MILSVSHLISVARGHALKGGATGAVQGTVTDDVGNKFYVSYSVNVIPGPGTNLFSSTTAMQKGVASLFYPTSPRSEKEGNVVLPTQDLGVDPATGKTLCSVDVELLDTELTTLLTLASPTGGVVMQAASVDLCHRRMRHINRKTMDVLRKVPANGIEYTEEMEACGTCPLGVSPQQDHPKMATYDDVTLTSQLVSVETLRPINPLAVGGYG